MYITQLFNNNKYFLISIQISFVDKFETLTNFYDILFYLSLDKWHELHLKRFALSVHQCKSRSSAVCHGANFTTFYHLGEVLFWAPLPLDAKSLYSFEYKQCK